MDDFKFNNGNGTNGHIHACNGIITYSTTANGQVALISY